MTLEEFKKLNILGLDEHQLSLLTEDNYRDCYVDLKTGSLGFAYPLPLPQEHKQQLK